MLILSTGKPHCGRKKNSSAGAGVMFTTEHHSKVVAMIYFQIVKMDPLTTANVVTIIGWVVAFGLGLLSAAIAQKRGRSRKVIAWTTLSESNLLSGAALKRLQSGFGVPIRVVVDEHDESDLSTVRIRIASLSNVEVEHFTLYFRFGQAATLHVGRYVGDLGAYQQKLELKKCDNIAELTVAHINPGQTFDVEFLVSHYKLDGVRIDMAEAGVSLRQTKLATPAARERRIARLQMALYVTAALLLFTLGALASLIIMSPLIDHNRRLEAPSVQIPSDGVR